MDCFDLLFGILLLGRLLFYVEEFDDRPHVRRLIAGCAVVLAVAMIVLVVVFVVGVFKK